MAKLYSINTVHLCSPLGFGNLMYKKFKNYAYSDDGKPQASGDSYIHRYAKDYEVDNTRFTMLLLTKSAVPKKVEDFFDATLKKLKADNLTKSLLTKMSLHPVELKIKFKE